uniref:Uncharacterized protein n=1 Tax=Ananas comosus var. bracteatus TaxID=296719 RepID=A0A6V7PQ51_ANACO|nr:unnamed protein product [Ananas comosus var. bracteatus]
MRIRLRLEIDWFVECVNFGKSADLLSGTGPWQGGTGPIRLGCGDPWCNRPLAGGGPVSERVGEDGSSIRRASAEKSPNQVLEGSLRPEELKRRARTATSCFYHRGITKRWVVTIPKQSGSLLWFLAEVAAPLQPRSRGLSGVVVGAGRNG